MLVSAAVEARAVIFIPSRPGQFVLESEPLAIISPAIACAKETKCLVPAFDGAYFSHEWKEALWGRFYTGAPPRQRRSVERYSIVKRG